MAGELMATVSGVPDVLTAKSNWTLRSKRNVKRSALYLVDLKQRGIPRRARPGYVLDVLEAGQDRLRNRDLTPFTMDDAFIDAVFGEDGSCRWWDDFCAFAYREPDQLAQRRIIPRLQAIDFVIGLEGWNDEAFARRLALVSPAATEGRP